MAKKSKKLKKKLRMETEPAAVVAVVEAPAPRPAKKARVSKAPTPPRVGANGGTPPRVRPEVTARLMAQLRDEAESMELWTLKIAAARKRRDALIVKIADRGVSEREIARAGKVTSPRVNQIYHGTGKTGPNDNGS